MPEADLSRLTVAAMGTSETRAGGKRQEVHLALRLVAATLALDEDGFRAPGHARTLRRAPPVTANEASRYCMRPSYKESAMGSEWVLVLLLKVGEYEMSTIPGFVSEQRCREAGEQWKVEANKFRGISGGQYLCLRKNNS
jgi:hypothetical protein